MEAGTQIFERFVTYIIDPTILLIFAASVAVFVFGIVRYIYQSEADDKARSEGIKQIAWGLVGMFVMVSVYSIIALIDNTFDLNIANPNVNLIDNSIPTFR